MNTVDVQDALDQYYAILLNLLNLLIHNLLIHSSQLL